MPKAIAGSEFKCKSLTQASRVAGIPRKFRAQKAMYLTHAVILPDRTLKNGASLILPSSNARNSSAPNAKRIFEIL